jgi:hypothetical protein
MVLKTMWLIIYKKTINMIKVTFRNITYKDIWACFFPKDEWEYYMYLGYVSFLYRQGTKEYELIKNLVKFIEKEAKPFWCPRFVLRLLHLYGNDNSIVRCRSQRLSSWHRKLLGGIFITDMKTKWDSWDIRVYGSFTKEINNKIYETEEKIYTLRP